ncbi:oligosaccharide repeat unit polymerase [Yoonia sp. BS5-3]|uniref:Oligosaccharide repeat unit polymerase n=1 Tax=Yoonia phaeophyticola TaxID=3137369 RepID=A0ABZ2V639_9RHOB
MAAVLIGLLALFCTILPFWMGQRYGVLRMVSPMHLLSYFTLFGFLLKVIVNTQMPELAFYRRFVDNPWGDQLGALYLALFILAMCLGYRLACTPVRRSQNIQAARIVAAGLTRRGALSAIAFAMTLGTIIIILRARGLAALDLTALAGLNSAKQINVNADGVGATLAGIKTFFIVPKFAFVLFLAHALVLGQRASWVLATVLGALLVLIALVSGDRFELVELGIFVLATLALTGVRLRGRLLIAGMICICGLAAVSAYMTILRQGGQGHGLLQQIVGSTYFLDINTAIMVTDRVRPEDYLWGDSYTWWRFGWIPRAIWAEKPAIDLGVFFKQVIMDVPTGGAFNVTGPGEAFINFGWAGVLVGAVLGWVYRRGEELLLSAQMMLGAASAFLYPMLFYPFIQATLQSSFSAFIVGAAAQLVLIVAMTALFLTRYRLTTMPPERQVLHAA